MKTLGELWSSRGPVADVFTKDLDEIPIYVETEAGLVEVDKFRKTQIVTPDGLHDVLVVVPAENWCHVATEVTSGT